MVGPLIGHGLLVLLCLHVVRLENLAMVSFCEGDDRRAEEGFRRTHDLLVRGGADPFGLSVLRLATNASIAACRASARKF